MRCKAKSVLDLTATSRTHIFRSRRKGPEFASEFFHVVPRALRHMLSRADESTQRAVRRVVKIWDDRRVFGLGGGRLLAELLQEGGAAPDAPLDEGLLAGLEGAIAALQRAREAHLCAREAVASLATFSPPDASDVDAVARARACLAADHAAIAGEAAALQTAAAHPLFANGAAKLAAGATAAAEAARSAAALVADLDRVAPSPRSPEVVAPGGPARHGGAEPAGADPLDICGDLAPSTGLDKFPDSHTALQPAPQAAEEYDPDDPF